MVSIRSMRDIAEREGVKQEKCVCVLCMWRHVSVRVKSERNLPNLVTSGVEGEVAVGLSLSRDGEITMLKSPAQIAGTRGCLAIKATPSCSIVNWRGGGM